MSNATGRPVIRLRGVRHHNLKNLDLDLPLHRLIVITGLSGSGKSSLAFDTLFAEGQRRYIETFSPYARQFFDRMDKPQVDSIEGIPPAIAIEQRNTVRTTRSTVGTLTEICDYLRLLWPHVAHLHCRQCGQIVRKDSPQDIWAALTAPGAPTEVMITFDLALSEKLSLDESLELIAKQGYQRLLVGSECLRLEQAAAPLRRAAPAALTIVQDRLRVCPADRARFVEACEQAYHFGKGALAIRPVAAGPARHYSSRLHCAACNIEYREPSPALFSFNHPQGACPACRGFGRTIAIDYARAIPDWTRTLEHGVVKPWQTGLGAECQDDLLRFCRLRGVPTNVPFNRLEPKWQEWVIHGDSGYGQDPQHEWPRAWYGVKGYFRWLESKAYKMHVRVLLARYRCYQPCSACGGKRFQPEALWFRAPPAGEGNVGLTLADFYGLPIRDAAAYAERLAKLPSFQAAAPLGMVLNEVRSRLSFLVEVGLGYLTLDRPTRSLSGGETERVNLTTCLGTRLVNTLFVLDEPSVGLHPCDTARLVRILQRLRDAGNTVVVVEHEAAVIRAADHIVDLGPGHGETGGHLVFQGSFRGLLKCAASLTGQYLSGRRQIDTPFALSPYAPGPGRASDGALVVAHARRHNLQDLTVEIPLGRLVCVTGVSGSGKTTLVREVLLPALEGRLKAPTGRSGRTELPDESEDAETEAGDTGQPGSAANLTGWERLGQVVLVDQSLLGRTPRSNPVVYLGAFDHIRDLFAQSEPAKQRGLSASAFSFNSPQGQCERCRGAGFEKIEMQFLSDVFIQCPDCGGRRYRAHILEVKVQAPSARPGRRRAGGRAAAASPALSIADFLATTVDEALELLARFTDSKPARRAADALRLLQEAGLGYLRLGQPINTLSGGESQRLKLASHLAAAQLAPAQGVDRRPTLFLFDEPTTGLHCEDVRLLLNVFERLVKTGHSVLVIEHNLDVIRCADWVIDLGPGAGDEGGRLVIAGTPRQVAACSASQTGAALCADAAVRSGTSDTGAAVSALRKFVVRQPAPTSH